MTREIKKLSESKSFAPYANRPEVVQARERDESVDAERVKDLTTFLSYGDHLEKKSLAIFAIKHCVRRTLPYGIWYCEDGREVLFNREYQAIAQRVNGVVSYADRDELVEGIVRAEMLYTDMTDPSGYLLKHLGGGDSLTAEGTRLRRAALLRTLAILREFTPKEHISVNRKWSLQSESFSL